MPILEVKNLSVGSADGRVILKNLSFFLEQGEILGILGESGSGKSLTALSLLRLLPANLKILSGEILFDGKDLVKLSSEELQHLRGKDISIIFQDPLSSLNPVLKVEEQLKEVLHHHLLIKGDTAKALILKTLREVGISDPEFRLKSYPHELSGGLRQRIMIAMSILCAPKLLIADEPTTALDLTLQMQIIELLKELNSKLGLSILFITHDLGVLRWLAKRILVYYQGQIVEVASTEKLFNKPCHPYTQLLFSSYPGKEKALPFSRRVDVADPIRGCDFWSRCVHSCERGLVQSPPFFEVEPGHKVRCFLYEFNGLSNCRS
ncbi:MAG: ABC transporter ATP-binding protein [Caldimicrobium sp.]|nr:ABC transporter ATP-binding protein [Caldimicrobium sp.]MCX7873357.1 ABC transporter ATP-binding protein [Caldimicrobium sp.]MDW8093404.1 ABC transporter ATP-binding protein [Caldimicrobium sp.]